MLGIARAGVKRGDVVGRIAIKRRSGELTSQLMYMR
jgi:hypothetical protein